jgi:hypothetical protein
MRAIFIPTLILLIASTAFARIKLITLPVRERVEIQLDHPYATLVEEERIVPLVKGENQVDFSWANTQIDPNTIVFRVIAPAGDKPIDVKVLSVSGARLGRGSERFRLRPRPHQLPARQPLQELQLSRRHDQR